MYNGTDESNSSRDKNNIFENFSLQPDFSQRRKNQLDRFVLPFQICGFHLFYFRKVQVMSLMACQIPKNGELRGGAQRCKIIGIERRN
jgi:hypothetical protein